MAEFNSKAIEEFSDIWVFCEQRAGKLMETDFELLSEGRKLADQRGSKLVGLLIGNGMKEAAKQLGGYGADKVIYYDAPELEVYTNEAYSKILCEAVKENKPEVLLIGATYIGRDLGPRCAAALNTGMTADCTRLDIEMNSYVEYLKENSNLDMETEEFDMADTNLKMTKPAFGGHLMATIFTPKYRPCMATVRPGVMEKSEFDQAKADACELEIRKCDFDFSDLKEKVLEVVKETKDDVDLNSANVIVSLGLGASSDIEKAKQLGNELAEVLGGGVVVATRPLVDKGLMDVSVQVGQTGKTVHPKIFVALGVSGAIQHLIGVKNPEVLIAVNKDKDAPIMAGADYALTGDMFRIVPEMIEAIKARKNK